MQMFVEPGLGASGGINRALALVVIALALVACTLLDTARLVPDTSAGPSRKIPLRVRLAQVDSSQKQFFGGPRLVDSAEMSTAVVATLNKSGIFAGVSSTDGDIDLVVAVLSQDQPPQSLTEYTARMLVAYKFVAKDGSTIWSETYDTSFSAVAFNGATRTTLAREGAVRENLAALILGIKERWPVK